MIPHCVRDASRLHFSKSYFEDFGQKAVERGHGALAR
jgi:hypothetical protein